MSANSSQTEARSTLFRPIIITFVAALTAYLLTLAPGITWAHFGNDGGDLITAAATLGIPHPPGYSTFTLLGYAISKLPFGTVAYRFNLFSALTMAGAATILAATLSRSGQRDPRRHSAIAATALTFAFASGIWRQAVITEVYGLNLLLLAMLLYALSRQAPAGAIGVLWGLSMTTHLTSLLFAPLLAFMLPVRSWWRLVAGTLLGLLPLAVLPLLAAGNSPVVWGDATTLSGWWWLVSGRVYRPNVLSFQHILPHLQESWHPALQQFGYVGWPLVVTGFATQVRSLRDRESATLNPLGIALSALAYATYAISYDAFDYTVFALPVLLLLGPLLFTGLQRFGHWGLLLPVCLLALNFASVDLHGDTSVQDRATLALSQLPDNALALTPGDQTLFTLWYLHYVENQRADIVPIDKNLMAFEWYRNRLQHLYPDLLGLSEDNPDAFEALNGDFRPICNVSIDPDVSVVCKAEN